jgi:hypothetical protein
MPFLTFPDTLDFHGEGLLIPSRNAQAGRLRAVDTPQMPMSYSIYH